jgi:nicotinamidase-related amidase
MHMEKFCIDPRDSLFLLIDFQTNLASAMQREVFEDVERNVGLLISACDVLNMPVLVTEQYKKGLGQTVERIRKKLGDRYKPFEKLEFSCWQNPDIREELKRFNKKYIIISGIEAHVCVLQSVLDLVAQGYYVHAVSDAACSRHKDDWRGGIAYMQSAGAVITTTEIVSFELLKRAGTPEFKALSPLFKNKETFWSQ